MEEREFLQQIQNGQISLEEGVQYLKESYYKNLGYARLDFDRKRRRNFPEVIFAQNKEMAHLLGIFRAFYARRENILATRVSQEQYKILSQEIEGLLYDASSKTVRLEFEPQNREGLISICCGGTSDVGVCEEARITAEFFGANVQTFYDIGVSSIRRVLDTIEDIKKANVIIAVAGMEGALPTVIAGMCDKPIIAVPTSVGYGANFGGISALLTMINTCAEGVSVINIDNGYGAGYNAAQINRLISRGGK